MDDLDRPLSNVWMRLVEELTNHQDREPAAYSRPLIHHQTDEQVGTVSMDEADLRGFLYNPACEFHTIFDTGCGARAFATELLRTGDEEWRDRAISALRGICRFDPHSGVHEPKWDPVGWHFSEGSLYATGVSLENVWATQRLLSIDRESESELDALQAYLDACHLGAGRYAHDVIRGEGAPGQVINTAAIALYLFERYRIQRGSDQTLSERQQQTIEYITIGQRADGFWPYINPGLLQRTLFRRRWTRWLLENRAIQLAFFRNDSSILFGDTAHHCYTLYYLLKALEARDRDGYQDVLERGFRWLQAHIVESETGNYRIDFDWEPKPSRIRYGSFTDTNTYFLVLAMLPHLQARGIVTSEETDRLASGLLSHVEDKLMTDTAPCIEPFEADYEHRRKMLPQVWCSVGWKASLLAEFIEVSPSIRLE